MIRRQGLLWRTGAVVVVAAALAGCNSSPPVVETPPPPVSVAHPVVGPVTDFDDYEGRIAASEVVEVRASVRGYLDKIDFDDGQIVKPGKLLFEIDPREYQNALDIAKALKEAAEKQLGLAQANYDRSAFLFDRRSESKQDFDVNKAKLDVAKADVKKTQTSVEEAELKLSFTKVAAKIGGKISKAQVTVGNLINTGGGETLLATITSQDPMYVYFDIDERSLNRYRDYQLKRVQAVHSLCTIAQAQCRQSLGIGPIPYGLGCAELLNLSGPTIKLLHLPVYVGIEGEKGHPHEGVIDYADNRVNAGTGTFRVRGVLPNGNRAFDDGMRARVHVPVSEPYQATLLDERAIGTDQGRKFVYVVNDDNVAEKRDIEVGRLEGTRQIITSGITANDWVVVNGIQRVRDGMKVEPKGKTKASAATEPSNQGTRK
jgi:RND family efflux transporter MFP subunit